jgi:ammonia channel protein AmtB
VRLRDAVTAVRKTGDFTAIQQAIPYARFMGITAELIDGDVIGRMRYSEHLVGNA